MQKNSNRGLKNVFTVLFLVLTFLCWCPLGYGLCGEVGGIWVAPIEKQACLN